MSKRNVQPIRSEEQLWQELRFVINYIYTTPSMTAKMPKMILGRVDEIMDYWRKASK